MQNQLFVINCDNGTHGFYTNLEKAKQELLIVYNKTPDFKHFGYEIDLYELVNEEYVSTNTSYTYRFDTFIIHSK